MRERLKERGRVGVFVAYVCAFGYERGGGGIDRENRGLKYLFFYHSYTAILFACSFSSGPFTCMFTRNPPLVHNNTKQKHKEIKLSR